MDKRLFQILDEMNVADGENNTAHLQVLTDLVSARTAKGGGHVTMGAPSGVINNLVFNEGKYITLLLIIKRDEYEKAKT